jgi:hypothetical protein
VCEKKNENEDEDEAIRVSTIRVTAEATMVQPQ